MPRFTWPQVVIALGAITAVVVLALAHVDTTALIGLIIALLLGGVFSTVVQVKDQTNGNHTALVDTLRRQSDQLARAYPVDPDTPTATIAPPPPTP